MIFSKKKLLVALGILLFCVFVFSYETPKSNKNIVLSDYLIVSTEYTFNSKHVFIESYNKHGELIDKVKLYAPIAWLTGIDNNYISIYGSNNYYIINTKSGEISLLDNICYIEESCIVGNNLILMSNEGISNNSNTYQSTLYSVPLDKISSLKTTDYISLNTNSVPCSIYAKDDKIYHLYKKHNPNFSGDEVFLAEYDLNFNLVNQYEIDSNFASILGFYDNNIILSSIDSYLLVPSMIKIKTPVEFDRFSFAHSMGKNLIRNTYSSHGKEVWIERINNDFTISSLKLNLKNRNETVCNIINDKEISTLSYQENIGKIRFFNINDKSYDSFEYTIKDGRKVIGAYKISN